ncbi:hypothetical protein BT63DRAFT_408906 [Microthyrium microscopicum]|uniref:Uncharacterized protein n=1 Tax=Microthyrium microscopicum TaxID=703497 RepID=A0A6A6UR20_9PEZI|nr:hypothetical protein BT63DRAFT_408906 [Microthyrium microscopicum]
MISIKLYIAISFLSSFVIATPILHRIKSLLKRQSQQLDPVRVFPGIFWDEAYQTCTTEELDIVVEATRMADEMINAFQNTQGFWATPAWNRYFVRDSSAAGKTNWYSNVRNQDLFIDVINDIKQASMFPKKGRKPAPDGSRSRLKQVGYSCKRPTGVLGTKCAAGPNSFGKWSGPSAVTWYPSATDGHGWAIEFCPRFFQAEGELRYINDITSNPKSEKSLPGMRSYEYAIAHEWMHTGIFGFRLAIKDLKEPENDNDVYGDQACHDFAWLNMDDPHTPGINEYTAYNADNYAWMFQYAWFRNALGWTSDGTMISKDVVSSDPVDIGDPIDDPADGVKMSDIDLSQSTGIPINCQPGPGNANDGNPETNTWTTQLTCAYVGEDYSDFLNDVKAEFTSDGGCTLSAQCNLPFGDGNAVDPNCVCYCDKDISGEREITPLRDPRCAGFAGSLPTPRLKARR